MAKILLISPPTIPTSPTMPLNLAYLAAYLERGNHIVKCIDYLAPYNPDDAFRIVEEFKPDIVGFTLRIDSILEKYEFMKRLKKKYPKALYVAGGSHASCAPEEVLRRGKADIVIIGEGEDAFADIANGIKKENIPGCVYLDEENNMKSTGCRKPIEDLDTIPSPAYHHFLWKTIPKLIIRISTDCFGLCLHPAAVRIIVFFALPEMFLTEDIGREARKMFSRKLSFYTSNTA